MADIPEHILRRSAEARAKAEGKPVDEVMAAMTGEAPPPAAPPAAAPTEQPAAAAEPAPAPSAVATAVPAGDAVDLAALSAETGVPENLLSRALVRRAFRDDLPPPAFAGQAAPPPQPVAAASGGGVAAPAAAPAIPEGVRTQRLLTVVKAGAIQQVKTEPQDKVSTWPHLLAIEFVALLAILGILTLMSIFIDAPLLEFANFNEQPNPSKAPWYFLGLQELLAYFDPQVAGVLIPTFGLIGLAVIPYVDRNPSVRPSDRKLAIMIFTVFFMGSSMLTIFGSFFRGPGFNFVFPWTDGIFFDDLKGVLE